MTNEQNLIEALNETVRVQKELIKILQAEVETLKLTKIVINNPSIPYPGGVQTHINPFIPSPHITAPFNVPCPATPFTTTCESNISGHYNGHVIITGDILSNNKSNSIGEEVAVTELGSLGDDYIRLSKPFSL